MGFIYKITNTINGKVYIGQTSRTVAVRWQEHKRYSRNENPQHSRKLYYAIRKYGIDSFTIDEIEECDDDIRAEREQYWISFYDSCNNGYNITVGGDGTKKFQNQKLIELWNKGLQRDEIANEFGICLETVTKRLHENGITSSEISERKHKVPIKYKMIHKYSSDGEYIESFDYEYAKDKLFKGTIPNNLAGKLINGFQWRYRKFKKTRPLLIEPKKHSSTIYEPKEVHQYTIDGQYIRSYDSLAKASKTLGGKGTAGIKKSCESNSRSSLGYRWSYEKLDCLPPFEKRTTSSAKVAAVDENNNIINVFDSIKSAAEHYHITPHSIYMVCSGRLPKTANTKFIYYNSA